MRSTARMRSQSMLQTAKRRVAVSVVSASLSSSPQSWIRSDSSDSQPSSWLEIGDRQNGES